MQGVSALSLILVVLLAAVTPLCGDALQAGETVKVDGDSSVQITSVSIEPSTIHKVERPNEATVTVQILVHGTIPPKSSVKVAIATYSAQPPENRVTYPKDSETVALDSELVSVRFVVQASPDTVTGKVVVAASLRDAVGVQKVKDPGTYTDWRGEVTTGCPLANDGR